ncbi:tocopherol cyclase family protein [Acetivibrio cellulolyticus]|uniref:tocopherol cyclase family protein n=1 Tax=Acetivibrio cellulolyticus TaxID=35830 RepID=UPI0001E2E79E|nr:tocopherol cyclase family protein [Acetivibrio cellulolyticus]
MYMLRRLWIPEMYQGKYKKRDYFEGWYYKLISKSQSNVLAIIPGVSYGKSKDSSHAFIQVIDAINCKVEYYKFDISSFGYSENRFEIFIEDNFFSRERLCLHLSNDKTCINGNLEFRNIVLLPKKLMSPGIMGPFSFVPFMECYHGTVNIHHDISGCINCNGERVAFDEGYGYIEKDWGSSFPKEWIWLQCNHFNTENTSIMFSIARIPWIKSFFIGFIAFLRIKEEIYRFATYTGAKIELLKYKEQQLKIIIKDRKKSLYIEAQHSKGGTLRAPKNGLMERNILESICANINIKLFDNYNNLVIQSEGSNAGMEIEGDILNFMDKTNKL